LSWRYVLHIHDLATLPLIDLHDPELAIPGEENLNFIDEGGQATVYRAQDLETKVAGVIRTWQHGTAAQVQ
jgi:hypothetical protein